MTRKIMYIITLINICFQVVYMTFGKYVGIELTNLKYIFYIFRPEYMIVSGLIAFLVSCAILALIIKSIRNIGFLDITMLILNVEYIIYYIKFLMKQ